MPKTVRRRRLEAKTDYKARLGLLLSGKPRLVVRKTNKYIIAQIVESEGAQDKVSFGVNSRELLSKGWPKEATGSLKSLQAAYLTGIMLGKIANKKVKEAVLDIGMYRNVHGSRLYAVLKGVVETGIKIPHIPEVLPSDDKLKNKKNINIEKIKENL